MHEHKDTFLFLPQGLHEHKVLKKVHELLYSLAHFQHLILIRFNSGKGYTVISFSFKEIIRHWNILARISRINHRLLKKPYMNISAGLEMLKANKRYVKLISEEDQQQRG